MTLSDFRHYDVLVIGGGFAGVAAAVRLREAGITDFAVLEKGAQLGGTWRDNTYPGCACDVPSVLYQFSFAPKPDWSRAFAGQDRKSTRLNSSHSSISYAVFCLKKKKKKNNHM